MEGASARSAELEEIHEECGIFGVWGHPDAARSHLPSDYTHWQHRGQEGAGIVSNDPRPPGRAPRASDCSRRCSRTKKTFNDFKAMPQSAMCAMRTAGSGGIDNISATFVVSASMTATWRCAITATSRTASRRLAACARRRRRHFPFELRHRGAHAPHPPFHAQRHHRQAAGSAQQPCTAALRT